MKILKCSTRPNNHALPFIILFTFAVVTTLATQNSTEEQGQWKSLYNGTFEDFRIYFKGQGFIEDADAQNVFVAEPDQIHVKQGTNGLITTNVPYSHYHVKVDYRWGAPTGSQNAGLMTHINLESTRVKDNRPRSVEINMRYNCPGSVWMGSRLGPFASTFIEEGTRTYLPKEQNGVPHFITPFGDRTIYARYPSPDNLINSRPSGQWNTLEAIVHGSDSVEIIHNGKSVLRIQDLRLIKEGTQEPGEPATEGGIGLQSENQEIFYRNFVIKELTTKLGIISSRDRDL